jgi:hypothetical protein
MGACPGKIKAKTDEKLSLKYFFLFILWYHNTHQQKGESK